MYSTEIIDYNYKVIYDIIIKYKKYYQNAIKPLKNKYIESLKKNDYRKLDKLLTEKRELEIDIIKKIIKHLNLDKDSYIFLHGSYAKKLNRWHSDIDINILYKRYDKVESIKKEELFAVMLYKIFQLKGRDKIHSMMIYTNSIYNYCPVITDNKYKLLFPNNKTINYLCRKNYTNIFPSIINTSRDISDFENYIIENSKVDFYEWLFSYYVLDNKKKIYNMIIKLDKEIISTKNFMEKLLLKIKKEKNNLKMQEYTHSIVSISKLNKNLKIKNMNKIYNLITILRLFLVYNKQKINNLDVNTIINSTFLENTLGSNTLEELKININKYMLFLSRIEYLMEVYKINFSSREEKNIYISNLSKKYYYIYSSSIKDDYYNVYIKLNKIINKILILLEGRITNE